MGLTTSLYTGLSGLNTNSQLITVSGNNIANVNTNGYKANRLDFESEITQVLDTGSAPNGQLGGTNPTQIGLGVRVGANTRNFNDGSIQPTGVNTDLALEGNGFFMLDEHGAPRFTRAGSFKLDRDFNLVSSDGGYVQGFGVDDQFNVVAGGSPQKLNIPLGALTLAEATKTVNFAGNLNAGGAAATTGAQISSATLYADATQTNQADANTNLTSLYDGAGTQLFATGDVITVSGVTKGSATLPTHTFQVGPTNTTGSDASGTTMQDFLTFLQGITGVDTTAGGSVTMNAGQIAVVGNSGVVNDLVLDSADVVKNAGGAPSLPFTFTKAQAADGESVRTTFVAYDSLGNAYNVDLNLVLEAKTNSGTAWRYYAQSEDDSNLSRVLGTGTLNFDTSGKLVGTTNTSFMVNRAGTGAATPQQITLAFQNDQGGLSALADQGNPSRLSSLSQDGSPMGTLQDFSVSGDGTIVGTFSNSLKRDLGRVAVATFTNPQGLMDMGGNLFASSINSGTPAVQTPGSGGAGRIVGGALELSNVDLSQEFINLISASTGFSANSRVLTTSDQLMQELMTMIR